MIGELVEEGRQGEGTRHTHGDADDRSGPTEDECLGQNAARQLAGRRAGRREDSKLTLATANADRKGGSGDKGGVEERQSTEDDGGRANGVVGRVRMSPR